ncbi:flagellar biosynthesis/type III secretory pathway-like protein [Clostridium gasigenes]|uniref:FliH/SctL family protein n=1 Tax=Clostridium gasigenes TaxID=94869 RepID=UPI001C0E26EE|nr:FliH/SctL family protein [Clostridium gasigenes]MBU3135978.1 flagellar biosynthesis/type III secretory pathway-like protein [Clostridium gasigenes]
MQSSYNLIKSAVATIGNNQIIATKYINKTSREEKEDQEDQEEVIDVDSIMQSYENIGVGIVKNAKKEAEVIVLKSLEEAAIAERVAYDSGYANGTGNGYEDGYKKGYEKSLMDTEDKVKKDIEKAESILALAACDYENYMSEKRNEILNLALEMAKVIASKELKLSEGILHLIDPILEKSKGEENIVIKCNPVHSESIREKLSYWQKAYAIKGEIFILEDTLMEPGNAEVQKKTGKTIVGMDIALQKLEELILK